MLQGLEFSCLKDGPRVVEKNWGGGRASLVPAYKISLWGCGEVWLVVKDGLSLVYASQNKCIQNIFVGLRLLLQEPTSDSVQYELKAVLTIKHHHVLTFKTVSAVTITPIIG